MSISFFKRKPLILLYVVGVLMISVALYLSWNNNATKPENVFWSMINQSMATSSVTVKAVQGQGDNSTTQTTQYSLGGRNISQTSTISNQTGTNVQADMISTPTAGYVRYNVTTDQKKADGKPMDFSKVNNQWAKSETGGQSQLSQDILNTGMPLGGVVVPIGNLNPDKRANLLKQIKEQGVYKTSFSAVKKEKQNGRQVYIYTVDVRPTAYANMMKSLAQSSGLHELDSLDTKVFEGKEDFELMLTVDVQSRHLIAAEAVGADIRETFSAYDVPVSIALPAKTISSTELQKRIQTAQQ